MKLLFLCFLMWLGVACRTSLEISVEELVQAYAARVNELSDLQVALMTEYSRQSTDDTTLVAHAWKTKRMMDTFTILEDEYQLVYGQLIYLMELHPDLYDADEVESVKASNQIDPFADDEFRTLYTKMTLLTELFPEEENILTPGTYASQEELLETIDMLAETLNALKGVQKEQLYEEPVATQDARRVNMDIQSPLRKKKTTTKATRQIHI